MGSFNTVVKLSSTCSHNVNQVASDDAVPLQCARWTPAQESRVRAGGYSNKIQWRTTWDWGGELLVDYVIISN